MAARPIPYKDYLVFISISRLSLFLSKVGVQQRREQQPSTDVQRRRALLSQRRSDFASSAADAPVLGQSSNTSTDPRYGIRSFLRTERQHLKAKPPTQIT